MTLIFEDDFETGTTTAWDGEIVTSGESLTVTPIGAIHGGYSLLSESVDAGPDEYAVVKRLLGGLPIVYARGYFQVEAGLPLPADNDRINQLIFLNCANIAIGKVGGVDQFQLRVYNPGGSPVWVVVNTGITPEMGKQYCLELAWKAGDIVEFYLNGQLVASQPLTGLGSENTTVNDVRFGLGVTVTAGHYLALLTDACKIGDQYIGPITPLPSVVDLPVIGAVILALVDVALVGYYIATSITV